MTGIAKAARRRSPAMLFLGTAIFFPGHHHARLARALGDLSCEADDPEAERADLFFSKKNECQKYGHNYLGLRIFCPPAFSSGIGEGGPFLVLSVRGVLEGSRGSRFLGARRPAPTEDCSGKKKKAPRSGRLAAEGSHVAGVPGNRP